MPKLSELTSTPAYAPGDSVYIVTSALNSRQLATMRVATTAAMTAILVPTEGMSVVVTDKSVGGLFVFDTSESAPGDGIRTFSADDTTTGSWVRVGDVADKFITPEAAGVSRNATLAAASDYMTYLSTAGVTLAEVPGDWTTGGGRNLIQNPESVNFPTTISNSIICLGGRSPSYEVTIGELAQQSVHIGAGDSTLNHLAGTIIGGAHHTMTQNSDSPAAGSHGLIAGGSYNENYGDYSAVICGTLNKAYSTKCTIAGGEANFIGDITNRLNARNAFIGGGYNNAVIATSGNEAQYGWITSGQDCRVRKDYGGAHGYKAESNLYGAVAQASGQFSALGDAQAIRMVARRTTTDETATQLLLDGSDATLLMPSNTVWTGRALISAVRTDVVGETASYQLLFSTKREAGNAVINSSALTAIHEDDAAWNVDMGVSTEAILIRGIGAAGKTIRWVASIEIAQVRNV